MVQSLRGTSLEERVTYLTELTQRATAAEITDFQDRLDFSWIYHDSALEGQVYTFDELRAAVDSQVLSDASLIPVYDEIRQHKQAIHLIRELADKRRGNINLDVIKSIYLTLVPEEAEGKGAPRYRKDMPLHRLYFHDIATPDKIAHLMRQLIDWVNSPETRRSTHTVRLAAKAHYKFLHIYPFPKNSGKVGRLLMNLILIRQGYPPAVIHATERQRYYDSLKAGEDATAKLVTEALGSSVESAIRHFEPLHPSRNQGSSPGKRS